MTSTERYWVVGGEYSCTEFMTLKSERPDVAGPFATRDEAKAAWRRLSDQSRSCATARYAITAETLNLPH
jgi:hypothetical protein